MEQDLETSSKYVKKDGELFKIICEENMCRLIKVTSENDFKGIVPPNTTPKISPRVFKKIWMKLTSNAIGYDWTHSIVLSDVYKTESPSLELYNFVTFNEIECDLPNLANTFYILYHVNDNYSDSQQIFLNYEEAYEKFFYYTQQQEMGIEDENIIRAVKKTSKKIESTLYNIEKNLNGPNIYYRSRWILERIN